MQVSAKLIRRIRDYGIAEPSFTASFAAWDLSTNHGYPITSAAVSNALKPLIAKGIFELIEDHGKGGKVYAYVEPTDAGPGNPQRNVHRLFPELDTSRHNRIGIEVPHTGQAVGPSGQPSLDRQRQEAGFRIKRARNGT